MLHIDLYVINKCIDVVYKRGFQVLHEHTSRSITTLNIIITFMRVLVWVFGVWHRIIFIMDVKIYNNPRSI